MSFWVVVPSYQVRTTPSSGDVCLYAVEVGVQALSGDKTRRTVHRRFSDFTALAARLRKELGADKALPPEPPKQRLARVDAAFLDERRRALEAWLWALLSDVEVAHSNALVTFLELAEARKGLRRLAQESGEAAQPAGTPAAADGTRAPQASPAPPPDLVTRSAAAQHVLLSSDQRATVRRTLSALQQRYAATKADLADALACLRSDAAVKALLSCHVDKLEQRVAQLTAAAAASQAVGGTPSAAPAEPQQGVASSGPQQQPAAAGDDACAQTVSLAWALEEARSALRASEAACAVQAAARNVAERRATAAEAEVANVRAQAEASHNAMQLERAAGEEASARAAAERKLLAKEVKMLRRELAAASAAAAATASEAAAAAREGVSLRLAGCIREGTALRERLTEATVEHMATEGDSGADGVGSSGPLELLSVSDARIAVLTAEAQLLGRNDASAGEADADAAAAEGQVRQVLSALLSDNSQLQRRLNSLLRATLGNTPAPAAPASRRPW